MRTSPLIRRVDEVAPQPVEHAPGATIQVLLGPDDGMPRFYTRLFTIAPGGRIPAHRHDEIEHEQVVVEGEMLLTLDGEERTVRAGDVVYIPQRVVHAYENRTPVPVRFLCAVPATVEYRTDWIDA